MNQGRFVEFLCPAHNDKLIQIQKTEQESKTQCLICLLGYQISIQDFSQLLDQRSQRSAQKLLLVQSGQVENVDNFQPLEMNIAKTEEPQDQQSHGNSDMQNNNQENKTFPVIEKQQLQDTYIKKWLNFSIECWSGYLLSDGAIGVSFEDFSQIIMRSQSPKFYYIEIFGANKLKSYNFSSYPSDLEKKVSFLKRFQSILNNENNKSVIHSDENQSKQLVYLKRWMKKKEAGAILFRLSNKVQQVNFKDKYKFIFSYKHQMVTQIRRQEVIAHYPLSTFFDSSNKEILEKLKHVQYIVITLLERWKRYDKRPDKVENLLPPS